MCPVADAHCPPLALIHHPGYRIALPEKHPFPMDKFSVLKRLLDRQLALLVDSRYNRGLPSNLSGATPERAPLNHGYKAVQIGASAWTAEAAYWAGTGGTKFCKLCGIGEEGPCTCGSVAPFARPGRMLTRILLHCRSSFI